MMSGIAFALCFIMPFVLAGLFNSGDDDEPMVSEPEKDPHEDPKDPHEDPNVPPTDPKDPPVDPKDPQKDGNLLFDDYGDGQTQTDDGLVLGSDKDDIIHGGLQGEDGDASIDGGMQDDALKGMDGDDCIFAGVGDDTLFGGEGDDELYGGDGDDWVSYEYAAGPVLVDLENGTASGEGEDTFYDIEKLRASEHDDTIFGSPNVDYIHAGAGDDMVHSSDADDHMTGGEGTMDVINYSSASAAVTVDLANASASGQGNDTIEDFEGAEGSEFDDTLLGDAEHNRLEGNDGDDIIDGRGGNDLLIGGAGHDTFVVHSGDEILDFDQGEDSIDLSPYYDTLEEAQQDLDTNGYLTQVGTEGLTLTGATGVDLTEMNSNLGVGSYDETDDVPDMPPVGLQIGTESTVTGTLSDSADRDAFRIALQSGETYTFDLTGDNGSGGGTLDNPLLRLFNEAGTELALNDDVSGSNEDAQITFTPTESGTYFIVADSAMGSSVTNGTYTLQVSH